MTGGLWEVRTGRRMNPVVIPNTHNFSVHRQDVYTLQEETAHVAGVATSALYSPGDIPIFPGFDSMDIDSELEALISAEYSNNTSKSAEPEMCKPCTTRTSPAFTYAMITLLLLLTLDVILPSPTFARHSVAGRVYRGACVLLAFVAHAVALKIVRRNWVPRLL